MNIEGTKKFVAQVKPVNQGQRKWQFQIRVALELLEEDGMLHKVLHARAAKVAEEQRATGFWPKNEDIVVWYAEIDEDMDMPINQVDWHALMEPK